MLSCQLHRPFDAVNIDVLCLDPMLFLPLRKLRRLNAVLHDDDLLVIQSRQIRHGNILFREIRIQVISFLTHRQLGKQHLLCALVRVGERCHQIDFPGFEHSHQFSKASLYILVLPSGVTGYRLFVLISVPASTTIDTGNVIGILIPAHTYNLGICLFSCMFLFFRTRSHRQ